VTEHEGRVLCSACLRTTAVDTGRARHVVGALGTGALALLGVVAVWLFFSLLGELLLRLPDAVHEGSVFRPADTKADGS
jgi:hypothetical protein